MIALAPTSPKTSVFAPLRNKVFAVLWGATVLGNTGSFLRDVVSAWLVTDLSNSATAVAAIQAAAALPIFLFAIPAGVLSDVLDRRRFLIAIQLLLSAVSLALCILVAFGAMSVASLLALTFVGGVGAALMGPTWQSVVPELVLRADLKNAVALNSLGINISRSIGPAVGGVLIASFGAATTYGMDIIAYVFVILALLWWPRPKDKDDGLAEKFGDALRAGYRYARHSHDLHVVLWRALFFFAFSSGVWALMPLVAREQLGGDAAFYGLMLGAIGLGAVAGAMVLPRYRDRLGADGLMLTSGLVIAVSTVALTFTPPKWVAILIMLAMGGAWIAALTTLNATAQAVLPNWVRGRGLAVYLTVFNGAMAGGSLVWGLLAQAIGIPAVLVISAFGLAVVSWLLNYMPLPSGEADLSPSHHWPEPTVAALIRGDRGPVLVSIEYRVDPAKRVSFLSALKRHSQLRLRDGASNWGVAEDIVDPNIVLEWFMTESWAEHLRQHQRAALADADLHADVMKFHVGKKSPLIRHFVSIE
jgi:MFS family permease